MCTKIKELLKLIPLLLSFGCPVYDPPNPPPSLVYNCSNEAIYVYHSKNGKLQLEPRLELFEQKKDDFMYKNTGCGTLLQSPNYRVDAYEEKEVIDQYLLSENLYEDSIVFFFITEKVMREFVWKKIVNQQMYEKRMSLDIKEYNDLHRVITYTPKQNQ